MADTKTGEILLAIHVDSDKAIEAMAEYSRRVQTATASEKALLDTIKKSGDQSGELRKQVQVLRSEREAYNRLLRESAKEVQNNIKRATEEEGSLKSLRAELSQLTKQYDELGRSQREGAEGKAILDSITRVTNEIKSAEEETQRYYRNVGNYGMKTKSVFSSAASAVSTSAGKAAAGLTAVGAGGTAAAAGITATKTAMDLLNKNPIVAILALIASLTLAVVNAMKKSEKSMAALNKAMSAFRAIGDVVTKVLIKIGEALAKVIEGLVDFIAKILEAMGMGGLSDTLSKYEVVAQEELTLATKRREAAKITADYEQKIATYRAVSAKRVLPPKVRLAYLRMALKLEEQIANAKYRQAQDEYYFLKLKNSLSENDAAANDAETEAYVRKVQAYTQLEQKRREYNAQISELNNQIRAEEKAQIEERRNLEKAANDAMHAALVENAEIRIQGLGKELELERLRHGKVMRDLEQELKKEKITAKEREAIEMQIENERARYAANRENITDKSNRRLNEMNRETARMVADAFNLQSRAALDFAGNVEETYYALKDLGEEMTDISTDFNKSPEAIASAILNKFGVVEDEEVQALLQRLKAQIALFNKAEQNERKALSDKERQERDLKFANDLEAARLHGDNLLQLELQQAAQKLAIIREQGQLEWETEEEFRARRLAAETEHAAALEAISKQRTDETLLAVQAVGSAFNELSSLAEEFSEDSREWMIAQKSLSLASVILAQGVATAQAVAKAVSSSATWIDMLVAITSSITAVTAAIAPSIALVKAVKFSTGGYVSGAGTATSDSIPAMLSNGESVNNTRTTSMFSPILSSLNQMGGGAPIIVPHSASTIAGEDMLARSFTKGLRGLVLRVGVDEITRVSNRVEMLEGLGDV